jgi:hypothetical protein
MAVDWSLVLVVCFIIVIFPLVIVLSLRQYRTMKNLMEQQAMKRGGTVTGSYLLPVLKFPYRNLSIVVTSVPGSKYRQAKTEASMALQKPASANLLGHDWERHWEQPMFKSAMMNLTGSF